jgi:uncharacterized membrane protein (UPF0127 family)
MLRTAALQTARLWRSLLLPSLALALIVLIPSFSAPARDLPNVNVTFFDAKDRELCRFEAEPAVTREQQAQGLMFRASLRRRTGMLFLHDRDEMQSFWMKNTYIPLDLVFINGRYEVVHVHRGARPHDETVISSRYPARYVLEVNAGEAKECSISRGARARFGRVPDLR